MDSVYNIAEGCNWISDKIQIGEYFKNFKHIVPKTVQNDKGTPRMKSGEEMDLILSLMKVSLNKAQYQEISNYCCSEKLAIPNEPPKVDVDFIKDKRKHHEMAQMSVGDCELTTLKHLKDSDIEKENPAYLKYASTIWLNNITHGKQDLMPNEEFILVVRVYDPYKYESGSRTVKPMNCSHEMAVLGSQTLVEFRDKIMCPADFLLGGDISENPAIQPSLHAKDIFRSGFIFIEDVFYNDLRYPENRDYSQVIRDWAREKKLGPFETAVMESTKFEDLTIRFGYPYVYQHQGNCEHLLVFSDARLLCDDDVLSSLSYPVITSLGAKKARYCMICNHYMARWVTRENVRIPIDPAYFCDQCFKSYNYKDGKKIGKFKAYRFCDRTSLM